MKPKTKRKLAGAAAAGLVAAIAAGGTLAYLTDETEKRANNFTFASDSVDAMLTEPLWDGVIDYKYDDEGNVIPIYEWYDDDNDPDTPDVPVYGYTDGDKQQPITDETTLEKDKDYRPRTDSQDPSYQPVYGDEQAMNMIPGSVASKNPVITNTGVTDEWVAAKITFVYAAGTADAGKPLSVTDMAKVTEAVEIDYKIGTGDDWERINSTSEDISQIFYYKKILAKDAGTTDDGVHGGFTTPIFTTVKVKSGATNAQIKALEEMGGFAIWIEGFAVQSDVAEEYESTDTNVVTFKSWADDGGVVFHNTPDSEHPADVTKPGIKGAN